MTNRRRPLGTVSEREDMGTGGYVKAAVNVVLLVAAGVGFLAMAVYMARSVRRGGSGPPILLSPVTRRGRQRVNASYARHGWAKPYDSEGNLLPANQRDGTDN